MSVLAQLNIARMKVAADDPTFRDFTDALDPVNASAEQAPGFVWRLKSEEVDSPSLSALEAEGWLVNMSAWTSIKALRDFIVSPQHLAIMRRSREWFAPTGVHLVLWWLEEGQLPDFDDGMRRMEVLREQGPTPEAFNFSVEYDANQLIKE